MTEIPQSQDEAPEEDRYLEMHGSISPIRPQKTEELYSLLAQSSIAKQD